MNLIYKAAIFDMDGTIANTLTDIFDSVNEMLEHYNFPRRTFEEVRQFVGNGARKLVQRCVPAEKTDDADFIQGALEYYNGCYFRNMTNTVAPYKGIMELLGTLNEKKIPVGVCTNKQHFAAIAIAEKIFAPVKIDAIIGEGLGKPTKPDPTCALEIAENFGVLPEEVAYFGDSDTDMETANNAGFLAIGVSWGFRPESELQRSGAKIIIHTPQEIFEYITFDN